MTTAPQNQAAITAAIQAAATADLTLLQSFASTYGASFTTIENALTALAGSMSDEARGQSVLSIQASLAQALANFQTLISTTNAAQTAVPDV